MLFGIERVLQGKSIFGAPVWLGRIGIATKAVANMTHCYEILLALTQNFSKKKFDKRKPVCSVSMFIKMTGQC